MAATDMRVASGSDASACATSTGSDNALGKTAADADPEQNAQCDEACFGEFGGGNAGVEPGSAVALRFAEQKSSNPGCGVADAYAASGASTCTANATSTTPTRKRDLITTLYRDSFATRLPTPAPRPGHAVNNVEYIGAQSQLLAHFIRCLRIEQRGRLRLEDIVLDQ